MYFLWLIQLLLPNQINHYYNIIALISINVKSPVLIVASKWESTLHSKHWDWPFTNRISLLSSVHTRPVFKIVWTGDREYSPSIRLWLTCQLIPQCLYTLWRIKTIYQSVLRHRSSSTSVSLNQPIHLGLAELTVMIIDRCTTLEKEPRTARQVFSVHATKISRSSARSV